MDFMNCSACQHLVQVNPTGICLGCQMGFAGPQKDSWRNFEENPKKKGILDQTLEDKYAFKEREEPKSDLGEHQNGDSSGQATEASSSDRTKRRRQAKKETKETKV